MIFLYIILIVFLCIILIKSADLAINNLNKIALALNWNKFIISFFLVAIATSLPEIFIGITSAIYRVPALSLGNIVGANIINLTLILGLVSIIGQGVLIKKIDLKRFILMAGLMLFPFIFALNGHISRLEGAIILSSFAVYVIAISYKKDYLGSDNIVSSKTKDVYKEFIYCLLGVGLLVVSANLITKIAQILVLNFGLSLILTGVLILSLGTTLPELIFGIRATMRGHKEMALGCSLGTIITNSCLGLGLAATIYPISVVDIKRLMWTLAFLITAVIVLIIFSASSQKISRKEGVVLVLFYLCFLIVQIFIIS